jgi:hypothetical protein
MNILDKLACLCLASFFILVTCFHERLEPTQAKHLLSAPLLGRFLPLPHKHETKLESLATATAYYKHS